eukprot:1732692-Prymnesium_polylepis.1
MMQHCTLMVASFFALHRDMACGPRFWMARRQPSAETTVVRTVAVSSVICDRGRTDWQGNNALCNPSSRGGKASPHVAMVVVVVFHAPSSTHYGGLYRDVE